MNRKKLAENLYEEAKHRNSELLLAIERYHNTEYKRDIEEPPCIWQKGNARLLDYSHNNENKEQNAANIVLFIPSLINRYYILDLEKERSMLRFLSANGIYTLVLDWGEPSKYETNFSINDYIKKILFPAINFINKTSGKKITIAGYCMGGVLSLAAAQIMPEKIEKLALLATPWDFHCPEFSPFILNKKYQKFLASQIAGEKFLSAEIIQAIFYITDPFLFEEKFRRFLTLDIESRAAKDFIALENWVNDGVAMTAKVAHDCLIGWTQQNKLANNKWRLGKEIINPEKITQPCFIAIPKQDHIVPYNCAAPLAEKIKQAHIIKPSSGHVGMIVGSRAKSECWNNFLEWLQ